MRRQLKSSYNNDVMKNFISQVESHTCNDIITLCVREDTIVRTEMGHIWFASDDGFL